MPTIFSPAPAFLLPGGGEWVVLGILALLLFGYKRLPEAARTLGRAWGEFRKGLREGEAESSANSPQDKAENTQTGSAATSSTDNPASDKSVTDGRKSE